MQVLYFAAWRRRNPFMGLMGHRGTREAECTGPQGKQVWKLYCILINKYHRHIEHAVKDWVVKKICKRAI